MATTAGAVLFPESAPALLLSVPSDDVGDTEEHSGEFCIRQYPQPTTNIPPPRLESQEIASYNHYKAIEDLVEIDRDDDDDSHMVNTHRANALADADERGIICSLRSASTPLKL